MVLEVRNLSSKANNLKDINFSLRAGEILGFAGLVGAGRSGDARHIRRLTPPFRRYFCARAEGGHQPQRRLRHGIGFVPEDRKEQALIS